MEKNTERSLVNALSTDRIGDKKKKKTSYDKDER